MGPGLGLGLWGWGWGCGIEACSGSGARHTFDRSRPWTSSLAQGGPRQLYERSRWATAEAVCAGGVASSACRPASHRKFMLRVRLASLGASVHTWVTVVGIRA